MRQKIHAWLKQENVTSMSLYAISLLMMKGTSLIMLPFMAAYLSPNEFGHLELLSITTVFFSLLVGLSMHENLYRFVGTVKLDTERFTRVCELCTSSLVTSVLLASVFAILFSFVFLTTAISSHQAAIITLVISVEAPLAICLAWLRLNNKAWIFFKVSLATLIIQISLIVSILVTSPNVTLIFAVGGLCTVVQTAYLYIHNRFIFKFPSLEHYKKYLRYSSPLMLSAILAFGLSGAERWIIAESHPLETLGIYAVAAKFALALGILIQPFHMWWMPKRFELLETQGREKAVHHTQHGISALCILSILVTWISQSFINLALPSSYHLASQLVVLCIIIMLLKEMAELLNIGVLYAQKTHRLFYINVIATVIALSLAWYMKHLGVSMILLCLCLGQLVRIVLIAYLSQSSYPLPYKTKSLILTMIISVLFISSSWHNSSIAVAMLMMVIQPIALIILLNRLNLIEIDLYFFKRHSPQDRVGRML
ncbi:LPS biosynthesis protein [Vibrio zhanjiangensis]|uniref:LPS biosynthesis protein n=1 Tax=Vibrio zhanjiangensis TaxID=1046128 RepID=A0ABQ6F095_9VIBR|nr:lipopolysaccharide biosynthesis protein [Vibrio zhanjiangensis]GLT18918.1 LPS biosynthesis protein [Vibrio zhanjiangensis]